MIRFVLYRFLIMIPTVFLISIVAFLVILAPPGDFISSYVAQLEAAGQFVDQAQIEALRARYGLNQSPIIQYLKWIRRLLRGDLGNSLQWKKPVAELLSERLPWTLVLSISSLILVYLVGIPIGIISATHQYSVRDYAFTFFAFLGVAIPGFLSALIFLWFYFSITGQAALGLFSREFVSAPWSLAKLWDLLKHLWIPAFIVGLAGTAELIRFMRANLLDELEKPYVMVARAKGLPERRRLYKYPVRVAINPIVSTIGFTLPELINGALLASLVLGLPTISPVLLNALKNQDMFLAGSIVFMLSVLTVFGILISDLLLAAIDPRIRFGRRAD